MALASVYAYRKATVHSICGQIEKESFTATDLPYNPPSWRQVMKFFKVAFISICLAAGCTSPALKTAPTVSSSPVSTSVSPPSLPAQTDGIPPAIGEAPPRNVQLTEVAVNPSAYTGSTVRWGGTIVDLTNAQQWTQIEVQEHRLNKSGRPALDSSSAGRFVVRSQVPFNPDIYAKHRPITVIGVLIGTVDDVQQSLPLLEAENVYLWGQSDQINDDFFKGYFSYLRRQRNYYYPYYSPYSPCCYAYYQRGFYDDDFFYPLRPGYRYGYPWYWNYPGYWPRYGFYFGFYDD
jgi:outer membrane lipoprotein